VRPPRRPLAPLLVGVALAVGAFIGWHARRPPPPPVPRPASTPSPASVAIREAALVLRHQGKKQAEVWAEQVEVSADARFTRFRGISQATLYRDGTPALRLRAREIVLDRRTEDLTALGDIEIVSAQGDRMLASEARWSAAQRTLTFPRGVEITIGRHRVRADRLVVDLALDVLELEGDVDVTFTVDEPPPELRGSP